MFERRSQGGFRWRLGGGASRSVFRGRQDLTGTFQASLIWLRNPPLKARSGTSSKGETTRSPLPEKSARPERQNFIEVNPAQNPAHLLNKAPSPSAQRSLTVLGRSEELHRGYLSILDFSPSFPDAGRSSLDNIGCSYLRGQSTSGLSRTVLNDLATTENEDGVDQWRRHGLPSASDDLNTRLLTRRNWQFLQPLLIISASQ